MKAMCPLKKLFTWWKKSSLIACLLDESNLSLKVSLHDESIMSPEACVLDGSSHIIRKACLLLRNHFKKLVFLVKIVPRRLFTWWKSFLHLSLKACSSVTNRLFTWWKQSSLKACLQQCVIKSLFTWWKHFSLKAC